MEKYIPAISGVLNGRVWVYETIFLSDWRKSPDKDFLLRCDICPDFRELYFCPVKIWMSECFVSYLLPKLYATSPNLFLHVMKYMKEKISVFCYTPYDNERKKMTFCVDYDLGGTILPVEMETSKENEVKKLIRCGFVEMDNRVGKFCFRGLLYN